MCVKCLCVYVCNPSRPPHTHTGRNCTIRSRKFGVAQPRSKRIPRPDKSLAPRPSAKGDNSVTFRQRGYEIPSHSLRENWSRSVCHSATHVRTISVTEATPLHSHRASGQIAPILVVVTVTSVSFMARTKEYYYYYYY